MLPYTLSRLLGTQQALIERDQSTPDQWGAEAQEDWQPLASVACLFWWATGTGAGTRQPSREYATPQRKVDIQDGGLLVPMGTDVTESDQVAQINDSAGNLLIDGPFRIQAVLELQPFQSSLEGFLELSIIRTRQGK